jgi:O-antigen/teichoic acid export membrane protein
MTSPILPGRTLPAARARSSAVAIHGMHALWDQAAVSVASFLAMAFVGRLGQEELGVFALGISSFWLVAGVSNALVWTPYTSRAAHLSPVHQQRFRGESAGLNLLIGLLLAVMSLFAATLVWFVLPGQSWLVYFFLAFAPLTLTLTLREHARRIYIADFAGRRLLLFDVPISLALVALMALLFFSGKLSAVNGLLVTSLVAAPGLYISLKHIRAGGTSWRRVRHVAASNWPYAKWLLVVAVAWLASDGLLRWLLVGIQGKAAMGMFAGAFLIVSLMNPLLLAMTSFARSAASRKLAQGSKLSLTTATRASLRWLVPAVVLAFCLLFLFGNTFMTLVLGKAYADQQLVTLLALAVCLEAVVVPIEATFVALENGRLLSGVAVSRFAISMVLGLVLIPVYGALGVAVAMLGRSVLVLVMYSHALWKTHNQFGRTVAPSTHDSGLFRPTEQVRASS